MIRAIIARNAVKPVWWGTNETVSDFGGYAAIAKAVKDADHNVKVAAANLSKVSYDDFDALMAANSAYEQAKYDRAILDGIYDDTAY